LLIEVLAAVMKPFGSWPRSSGLDQATTRKTAVARPKMKVHVALDV